MHFTTDVPESLAKAIVNAEANVEGPAKRVKLDLSIGGKPIASAEVDVQDGAATTTFEVEKPELWYPVRYGKQPLYTLSATLLDGDEEIAAVQKRLGLRRARVVQRPLKDQDGLTFFFEINNIPIWCGGSNWIPADNFIPRITEEKYRAWLQLLVDGHQNMARLVALIHLFLPTIC